MTAAAKPDIPALVERLGYWLRDPDLGEHGESERQRDIRSAIAALTTAVEIGRAMGMADVAAIVEERRAAWAATEAELRNDTPDVARISGAKARAARELIEIIGRSIPPLDLDALLCVAAKALAKMQMTPELANFPERARARAVLSAIGIRAREAA